MGILKGLSNLPLRQICRGACTAIFKSPLSGSRAEPWPTNPNLKHFAIAYWRMKKGGLCLLWGISVFSPSVCRTASVGWEPGGRGSAGLRSSWVTFLSIHGHGRGYCQYMRCFSNGGKYPQNLPLTIDTGPDLWYSIGNLFRKELDYADHQKRRGHFLGSDREL